MGLKKIKFEIARGEGPLFGFFKSLALKIRHFNVPAFGCIYLPLFRVHMAVSKSLRWFLQKVYYEPLFKANCQSCGKQLKIDIRGPQMSSNLKIKIGENVTINGVNSFFSASINEKPELIIGDNTIIGFQANISVAEKVVIGNHCLISTRVAIMDNSNHPIDPDRRRKLEKVSEDEISPVIIEDNVWIGYQSYIGKGVRIGTGAIIGANSVVIKDVPPNSIVLGCPARKAGFLK